MNNERTPDLSEELGESLQSSQNLFEKGKQAKQSYNKMKAGKDTVLNPNSLGGKLESGLNKAHQGAKKMGFGAVNKENLGKAGKKSGELAGKGLEKAKESKAGQAAQKGLEKGKEGASKAAQKLGSTKAGQAAQKGAQAVGKATKGAAGKAAAAKAAAAGAQKAMAAAGPAGTAAALAMEALKDPGQFAAKAAVAIVGIIALMLTLVLAPIVLVLSLLFMIWPSSVSNNVHRDNFQSAASDLPVSSLGDEWDYTIDESYKEMANVVEKGSLTAYNRKKESFDNSVAQKFKELNKQLTEEQLKEKGYEFKKDPETGLELPIVEVDSSGKVIGDFDPTAPAFSEEKSFANFSSMANVTTYTHMVAEIISDFSASIGNASATKGNKKELEKIVTSEKVINGMFALETNEHKEEKERWVYVKKKQEVVSTTVVNKTNLNYIYVPVTSGMGTHALLTHNGKAYYGPSSNGNYVQQTVEYVLDVANGSYVKDGKEANGLDKYKFVGNGQGIYTKKQVSGRNYPELGTESTEVETISEEPISYKYEEHYLSGVLKTGDEEIVTKEIYLNPLHDTASIVKNVPEEELNKLTSDEEKTNYLKDQIYYEYVPHYEFDTESNDPYKFKLNVVRAMYKELTGEDYHEGGEGNEQDPNMEYTSTFNLGSLGEDIQAAEKTDAQDMTIPEFISTYKDALPSNVRDELLQLAATDKAKFNEIYNSVTDKNSESYACPLYGVTETNACGQKPVLVKDEEASWWQFFKKVEKIVYRKAPEPDINTTQKTDDEGNISAETEEITIGEKSDIFETEILDGIEVARSGSYNYGTANGGGQLIADLAEQAWGGIDQYGGRNYTYYALNGTEGVQSDWRAWCAYFIVYLFRIAGWYDNKEVFPFNYPDGSVPNWENQYGKLGMYQNGLRHPTLPYYPKPGDVIVWPQSHVEVVYSYDQKTDTLITIGGNTYNSSTGKLGLNGAATGEGWLTKHTIGGQSKSEVRFITPNYPASNVADQKVMNIIKAAFGYSASDVRINENGTLQVGIIGFKNSDIAKLFSVIKSLDEKTYIDLITKHGNTGQMLDNFVESNGEKNKMAVLYPTPESDMFKLIKELMNSKMSEGAQDRYAPQVINTLRAKMETTNSPIKGMRARMIIEAYKYASPYKRNIETMEFYKSIIKDIQNPQSPIDLTKNPSTMATSYLDRDKAGTLNKVLIGQLPTTPNNTATEKYTQDETLNWWLEKTDQAPQSTPELTAGEYNTLNVIIQSIGAMTEDDFIEETEEVES